MEKKKRAPYFCGLAFLGRSQPAVSGMAKVKKLDESGWVEVFRSGTWNGHTYTDDDLDEMANGYDPTHREATVGIGHDGCFDAEKPKHGVVSELMHASGRLYARFKQLSKELVEGVAGNLYEARSSEILSDRYDVNGVPIIFRFSLDTEEFIFTEPENLKTKPDPKGEMHMEEKDVRLAIAEAIKPFSDRLAELEKFARVTPEEYACAKAKLDKFDELETKIGSVQAENSTLQKNAAEAEVTALLSGIPKAFASDATRALLVTLAQTNREAFAAAAAPFTPMKGKFAYLTHEIVTEEGGSSVPVESQPGYVKGKSEIDNKISTRTFALIAQAEKDGKKLEYADAAVQAYNEVTKEEAV